MPKYTNDQLQSIHNEYVSGVTLGELNKKYGSDFSYLFKKYGFQIMNVGEFKTKFRDKFHPVIKYYFDKVTNDTEAYILGFIFADGYITNNAFGIKIVKSDEDLLSQIRDYVCPESKLYNDANSIKFTLCCDEIVKNLMKLGIQYNKSQCESNVPNIDYLSGFVRGYFDGNGTVYITTPSSSVIRISMCSTSESLLKDIQNVLKSNGIDSSINCEDRSHLGSYNVCNEFIPYRNMYRLYVNKINEMKKFHNFIYSGSVIRLNRKFQIINDYVNTELSSKITKGLETV